MSFVVCAHNSKMIGPEMRLHVYKRASYDIVYLDR